jgi:Acyl-protein synthetase, LuxE
VTISQTALSLTRQQTESAALHCRAQGLIANAASRLDWIGFAADVIGYQRRANAIVHRLASKRNLLDLPVDVHTNPAVPTDAFKLARVSCLEAGSAAHVFRTSGTSSGARGTHEFATLATYHAGALAFGATHLLAGMPSARSVLVLGPSAASAPDSSLASMNACFARAWSTPSPATYLIPNSLIELPALRIALADAARTNTPVLLLATSFALVHLFDALLGERLALTPHSRLMQTGGYKGKSRTVEPTELAQLVRDYLYITPSDTVAEYGMTELSSQFYSSGTHAIYTEPPWAWVTAVDPETLAPVAEGEIGIARIDDCLNIDSALAIQTQDMVRRVAGGFELLGRLPGAVPRGCSIAIDEALSTGG